MEINGYNITKKHTNFYINEHSIFTTTKKDIFEPLHILECCLCAKHTLTKGSDDNTIVHYWANIGNALSLNPLYVKLICHNCYILLNIFMPGENYD